MREISVRGARSLAVGGRGHTPARPFECNENTPCSLPPSRGHTPRPQWAATCGGGPILSRPARRYVARHPSTRMGTGTDVADALYERE
jgi:hypothetical protein